ncbi:SH3 domain containing ring finger posh isoform X2 [Arctopsyche grandis]|uniref:SH3 domain containing ring finger posh isoform X2 n=1 Tax=Arctopsyche grandis TaxID=121162 RepID=UPI00406D6F1B
MDEGLLNDLLECSVCLERLDTSSRVLPCQHTFCMQCLREIIYCQKELRCPECRVLVETPVEELPPNVLLMRILEGMRNSGGLKPHSSSPPPQVIPRRPIIGPATFMEPVSSYGFTYSDEDGKHTNVIPKCTPHARAVYDYFSKEPGDLSFKKSEVIILRRQIDTYWFHGETGGNQGAFPITYAKIIVPLPPPFPQCTALYDFHMAAPDEEGCLAFNKGAVINVIRRVDENWAEGRLHDKIGIFPIAFVEMNTPALAVINMPVNIPLNVDRGASTNHMVKAVPRSAVGSIANKSLQSYVDKRIAPQRSAFIPNQIVYQQQMSISSPVPNLAVPVQRQQHNMSQSHPAYVHQHQFHRTQESTPSASPYINTTDVQDRSIAQLRNLQIDSQNSERSNSHHPKQNNISLEVQGQSSSTHPDSNAQNSRIKDNSKYSNLTSSYHPTNNLSSDSSSTTTTPSFGGSSVTTTPNTSSSNTSSASESNTPSSPASPTSNAIQSKSNVPLQVNQNYCNVLPTVNQTLTPQRNLTYGNSSREDCDTSNSTLCENTSGNNTSASPSTVESNFRNNMHPPNNSPLQTVNGNILNVTPPRSNMSSPQTCLVGQNMSSNLGNSIPVQLDSVLSSNNQNNTKNTSPSQNMLGSSNHTSNLQYNPFINTSRTEGQSSKTSIFYTDQFAYNVISPRHGKDGTNVPRTSHSHRHHEKEKRHSLTPMSQNLMVTHSSMNRHSAEILGSTSGNLLDQDTGQEPKAISSSKHSEREKRTERERQDKDASHHGEKVKDRDKDKSKKSGNSDKSLPMAYVALYPYKPQKADELELKKGGLYMVLEQCQDGWFKGCSSRTKKCGVFPGNYVALASKSVQLSSSSSSKSKHQNSVSCGNDNLGMSCPSSSKSSKDTIPNTNSVNKRGTVEQLHTQILPPDLPPRSQSPGTSQIFTWNSTPKGSKSSDKVSVKEKNKSEKNSNSGVSLMKRLTGMKKSRSPPPSNHGGFSMDNPVFEDCAPEGFPPASSRDTGQINQQSAPQHPVHIRYITCILK